MEKLKTLILGIGNILMGDEGLGVHAVELIDKKRENQDDWPDGVSVMDGGTGGFHLLGPMQNSEKLIIIDASLDGHPPGTVNRLTPKYSSDYPPTITAHDVGLKDMIDAFYFSGSIPEVILYTVSISGLDSQLGMELSPPVKAAIPDLIERIFSEIYQESINT